MKLMLLARVKKHHEMLGLMQQSTLDVEASGTVEQYDSINRDCELASVRAWLIGSELYFAARKDVNGCSLLPLRWLGAELTASDYRAKKVQTTSQRSQPIWRLDREAS